MKLRSRISLPRRDDGSLLPAVLAAALLLAAAMQLALAHDPELPDARGVERLPAPLRVADPRRVVVDPEIGRRPLFAPTRRPGDVRLTLGGGGAAAPLGGAVVVGAVKARGIAYVLLKSPGGEIVKLRLGGGYLGWVLVSFSESGAQFRKGSDKIGVAYGATGGAAPEIEASEEQ